MTDEEYVRSVWNGVDSRETLVKGHGFVVRLPRIWHREMKDGYFKSPAEAWSAAAEFTRECLKQIRQVEDEIAQLVRYGNQGFDKKSEVICYNRILDREQAALAELKRGMK